ncbi:hypothetical protein V8D89_002337 [Ganoderma adspersum]
MGLSVLLRVPVDVWEEIIDHCHLDLQRYTRNYETLRACALVCSAWLPGSRRNLLREVRLNTSGHVDLLLRLLVEKPNLGELVMAIRVLDSDYVPFARPPLPQLVPNCRSLFVDLGWITRYPPGYPKLVSEYRGLKELVLRIVGLSAEDILHIIWTLPLLSSLTLLDWHLIEGSGSKHDKNLLDKHTPETCRDLKQLTIKSPTPSSVLCRQNFLPRGCFGHSITQLELIVKGDMTISQSFLECVGDFCQLRTLDITTTIYETFENHKPSDMLALVLQVLPHIQPGPQLRELRLQLNPMIDLHVSQRMERTYGITRHGLFDILCGAEMQKRFPSLELFVLWLWEHSGGHSAQWWTEQILDRQPVLQNVLQVQLMDTLGHGDVPFLWDPDGLAKSRGSWRQA